MNAPSQVDHLAEPTLELLPIRSIAPSETHTQTRGQASREVQTENPAKGEEMNAPIDATLREKADAFEWLRAYALSKQGGDRYAAVLLQELATAAKLAPPTLGAGEIYAGILLVDGKPAHHLILLPGDAKGLTWSKAGDWAKKRGGELPTRKEQALLFANAAEAFEHDWYWSCEQYAGYESSAWYQSFLYGTQGDFSKSSKLRARAVRRVTI